MEPAKYTRAEWAAVSKSVSVGLARILRAERPLDAEEACERVTIQGMDVGLLWMRTVTEALVRKGVLKTIRSGKLEVLDIRQMSLYASGPTAAFPVTYGAYEAALKEWMSKNSIVRAIVPPPNPFPNMEVMELEKREFIEYDVRQPGHGKGEDDATHLDAMDIDAVEPEGVIDLEEETEPETSPRESERLAPPSGPGPDVPEWVPDVYRERLRATEDAILRLCEKGWFPRSALFRDSDPEGVSWQRRLMSRLVELGYAERQGDRSKTVYAGIPERIEDLLRTDRLISVVVTEPQWKLQLEAERLGVPGPSPAPIPGLGPSSSPAAEQVAPAEPVSTAPDGEAEIMVEVPESLLVTLVNVIKFQASEVGELKKAVQELTAAVRGMESGR